MRAVPRSARPNGHHSTHTAVARLDAICPTCGQPVTQKKYLEIVGRERAREAEIARSVETRTREQALKTATASVTAAFSAKLVQVEREKKAFEAQAKAAVTGTKRLLDAQRAALEKSADARVAAEREKRAADNIRHEQELETLKRRVAKARPTELGNEGELDALGLLTKAWPDDEISRIGKGKNGGDILHRIIHNGVVAGSILYDCKNTSTFLGAWTAKLRQDQLAADADHGVLVTVAWPAGHRELMVKDRVLVVSPARLIAIATWLRMQTIRSHSQKLSNQHRSDKASRLYEFMCSPVAVDRWDRLAQILGRMKDGLRAERSAHERAWADRNEQLDLLTTIRAEFIDDLDRIFEATESESSP